MARKRRVIFRNEINVLTWSQLKQLRRLHGESCGINYRPLDRAREEIRLISVLPLAPGEGEDSTISCEIGHFPLNEVTPDYRHFIASEGDDAPLPRLRVHWKEAHPEVEDRFTWGDYAALSYTWGDPKILRKIFVNGRTVEVRENLEAALRMWRWRTGSQGDSKLMLWADALCINQTDKGEREREVLRMFQIYGQALDVIIWIGPEADSTDLAFDLVNLLGGLTGNAGDNLETYSKTLRETLEQDAGYLSRVPGAWSALAQLLGRPYFSRLWIVQEIAMGDPASPCICGRQEMHWSWFRGGLDLLAINLFYLQSIGTLATEMHASHFFEDTLVPFCNIIFNLETPKPESGYEPHRQGIPVLKRLAHNADASDERDRLYGLLNIMEPKVAALVKPDYTSTASTAYIEFSRRHIQHRGDLLSLGWVAPKYGFPSWAIHWSQKTVDEPGEWENYEACGGLAHTAPIRAGSRILACEALLVDSVDGLGADFTERVIVEASSQAMAYATAEDRSDAFFANLASGKASCSDIIRRSLVMPSLWDDDELEAAFQETQEHIPLWYDNTRYVLKTFLEQCFANRTFQMAGLDFKSYFDLNQSDGSPITCKESTDMFCDASDTERRRTHLIAIQLAPLVWNTKRLMTTRRGFFGWAPRNYLPDYHAPENVRQGDLIAIMAGCRSPLVLRSMGQHYRILGRCYVQGMMYGEYLSLLEKGEVQLQSITIC